MSTTRPAEHTATRRILELVQWNVKLFTASVGYDAGVLICLDAIISVVCEKVRLACLALQLNFPFGYHTIVLYIGFRT
ncbi:hypothetical protein EV401DRAFT_1951336, partial [Pisolithus croceorrhizus]